MKELILLNLFQLINATDTLQQVALKEKIVTFISMAEFKIDVVGATCTKRLIVNSLQDYVAAPVAVHRDILRNHYHTLLKVLA